MSMSIYWFLFVTLIILLAQGFIYRRFGFKRLHYSRVFSTSACFMGDEVQVLETISNRKLLPLPWLLLQSQIHTNLQFKQQSNLGISKGDYYQNHKSLFSLMPFTQITRKHHVICLKRGCYKLSTASMTCGDAFGIGRISATLRLDAELVVYPKLIPMDEVPLPSRSWQGEVIVRRWIIEDPFIIAGAREYRQGDPLGGINWKATARIGQLQVHNYDHTANHSVMIMVNFDLSVNARLQVSDPERIEKAISYAATLADWVISQGMEAGFACNGYIEEDPKQPIRVAPQGGQEALMGLLHILGKLVIARSIGFEQFLGEEIKRGTADMDIVLITAYISEVMEAHIQQLRAAGNVVTLIHLAADEPVKEVS
jgi:uncharacterized protein (DUF58 family)